MRTYILALLTLILLFVTNYIGGVFDLYTSVWFYDIPMHILGGLGIGLFIAAVLQLHGTGMFGSLRKRDLILWGVFAAGIAWEIFEAYYNIAAGPVGSKVYWTDTIKDLIDDMLGGVMAAYLIFPKKSGGIN